MDYAKDGKWLKSFRMNGKNVLTRSGMLWNSMQCRVKTPHILDSKIYHSCEISKEFKDFQFFVRWCNAQVGYDALDKNGNPWQLDKDVLVKGNRVYGPDTCTFLPNELNTLIRVYRYKESNLPPGVSYNHHKKRFTCNCSDENGIPNNLGMFKTAEDSFLRYKEFKEDVIKKMAVKHKDQIDHRAYVSLSNWQIQINDY